MAMKVQFLLTIVLSSVLPESYAQEVPFSPCPLLGPRFPIPNEFTTSPIIQSGLKNLTRALDEYVSSSNGTFGPTSPNTSFSIALFTTEKTNATGPFLYEYHHTSQPLLQATGEAKKVGSDSIYQIGDLTTLFTTWLFLIEAGEKYWDDPVSKWVPELVDTGRSSDSFSAVNWTEVTLGDLAAHLGGIGRYAPFSTNENVASLFGDIQNFSATSPCETGLSRCDSKEFLAFFGRRASVFVPGSTPIFSNAGYIILAFALESITGRIYDDLLQNSIIAPLGLSSTSYLKPPTSNNNVIPTNSTSAQWILSDPIEGPYNGLYSTVHDVSIALRAVLSSSFISKATTRR